MSCRKALTTTRPRNQVNLHNDTMNKSTPDFGANLSFHHAEIFPQESHVNKLKSKGEDALEMYKQFLNNLKV